MTTATNFDASFWQSRMTRAGERSEPLEIVYLPELAHKIRRTYPQGVDRYIHHEIHAPLATRLAVLIATRTKGQP